MMFTATNTVFPQGDGIRGMHDNEVPFSTIDSDNDYSSSLHCARDFSGAWWYNMCHMSNLNGPYIPAPGDCLYGEGINWQPWRGYKKSLRKTEMKIRPQVSPGF